MTRYRKALVFRDTVCKQSAVLKVSWV